MLKLLLGKLICWLTGKHKRGIPVDTVADLKTFACPRCGRTTQYRVKPKRPIRAVS